MCICVHLCINVCICVCMWICVCIYCIIHLYCENLCVYVCMCVFVYAYVLNVCKCVFYICIYCKCVCVCAHFCVFAVLVIWGFVENLLEARVLRCGCFEAGVSPWPMCMACASFAMYLPYFIYLDGWEAETWSLGLQFQNPGYIASSSSAADGFASGKPRTKPCWRHLPAVLLTSPWHITSVSAGQEGRKGTPSHRCWPKQGPGQGPEQISELHSNRTRVFLTE